MDKVFKLIDNIDNNLLERLILLDRLIRFYSRFLNYWNIGYVYSDGAIVCVRFERTNLNGYEGFTERVFPINDLGKRIVSYKRKIALEVAGRVENPRIQREKEIHKWKRYVEDAKIQMREQELQSV